MATEIEEKIVELISQLEQLATDVGADTVELAITTAQIAAVKELTIGFIGLICMVTFLHQAGKALKAAEILEEVVETREYGKSIVTSYELDKRYVKNIAHIWFQFWMWIVYAAIAFIPMCWLLDIWSWVGILEPKLWIAHQITGW